MRRRSARTAPGERPGVHIGTCGWHYAHWRGRFYPADLPASRWLAWYAQRLRTVEIDSTFYRLPDPAVFAGWREAAPAGFRFAVKAPRSITHRRKLRGCDATVRDFLERIGLLAPALGPVLFQLPPRWHRNTGRLAAFLDALPPDARYAFEFRDPTWHHPEVYTLLTRARAAFCIYDLAGFHSPKIATTDFVYLRLHGPRRAYGGSYTASALRAIADELRAWQRDGKEVYVFFDNDEAGYAARNAALLADLLEPMR